MQTHTMIALVLWGSTALAGCGSESATTADATSSNEAGVDLAALPSATATAAPTDAASAASASPAPAPANTSVLPIRTGYYAVNAPNHPLDCTDALRNRSGFVIDNRYFRDIDGDYPITPVRSLGNNRYRMGEAFETIRVINADSFVAEEGMEYERRFLWCAEREPR